MEYHILDNDYYKFTMQSRLYYLRNVARFDIMPQRVEYRFVNRGDHEFNFTEDELRNEINNLLNTPTINMHELNYLKGATTLNHDYLDWLSRLDKPYEGAKVYIHMHGEGKLDLTISGYWLDCILLEVPVMALISELNNTTANVLSSNEKFDKLYMEIYRREHKGLTANVLSSNEKFDKLYMEIYRREHKELMEFGTRRRSSAAYQRNMFNHAVSVCSSTVDKIRTSNVLLSMKNGLCPVGTIAHEWFLANYAMSDIESATTRSILSWNDKISEDDHTAYLTDTFTSPVFFKSLGANLLKVRNVRQDSGDPLQFVENYTKALTNAAFHNGTLKDLDFKEFTIIFSDSLNLEKVTTIIEFMKKINLGYNYKFGIGTYLSNYSQTPLNIVIKPFVFDYTPVCKLSDVEGKITGGDTYMIKSFVNNFLGKKER
jgi:nicotinate phosphoribosyltransferase